MKSLKKIIAIILIAIVGLILILMFLFKKYEGKPHEDFSSEYGDERIIQKDITRVSKRIDYYSVELIVNHYLTALITKDTDILYHTLNADVIKQWNVDESNVISKLNDITRQEDEDEEHYKFMITDMYFSESEGNIVTYFVFVKVINTVTEEIQKTSFMVETDTINDTYDILPFEFMKQKGYATIEEGKKYETSIEKIPNNSYNEIEYDQVDDNTVILNLMTNLIDKMVYDLEDSYHLYTDAYKKERFATLEEYKKYIEKNMKTILASSIEKYKVNEKEDRTEYICIDQYGNYYIFEETAVMQYTVQLDTYTKDSQEFLEKYNKGKEQLKVGMNLEKITQAMNRKDYAYIYDKLYTDFRQNNFPTLASFETYMQNNLFDSNKVDFGKFESKSGVYVYDTMITDATGIEEKEVEVNFIVKLEEGTNFAISFQI